VNHKSDRLSMNFGEYEIIKYRPEFKTHVMELQKHLWSTNIELNASYFDWKHEQNPYVNEILIYLAVRKGKVVGMRGMYGAKWQIGKPKREFVGLCGSDLVIEPAYRKSGIFRKMVRFALNDLAKLGYTYVFSLSAVLITRLGFLNMGWQSVGSFHTMVLRMSTNRPLRYPYKRSFLSSVEEEHPFYSLDRNSKELQNELNPCISVEKNPRPREMNNLIERIGAGSRIQQVRNQEYFAWRFKNPLSHYRFFFWEDNGLNGYLVLQTPVYTDERTVNIVDWEATDTQIRSDLLHAAIHLGNFECLTIWTAALPNPTKMLLKKTGFKCLENSENIRQGCIPNLLVRHLYDKIPKENWILANRHLLNMSNWDLRMIYSDRY